MIRARILRDDALWMLPMFLVNAAVTSSVLLGVLMLRAHRGSSVAPEEVFASVWLGLAWYLVFGRIRTRAGGLDLVLPLPARRLWIGHVLAVLLGGAIVSLGPLGMLALWNLKVGVFARPGFRMSPIELVAWVLAGLTLAVILLEVPRPRLARTPARRGWRWWTLLVALGVPFLVTGLGRLGPAWLLAAPIAAGLVGAAIYDALPGGFTIIAREAVAVAPPGRQAGAGDAWAPPVGGRMAGLLLVLRSISIGHKDWLITPFIAGLGFLTGGGLGWWGVGRDLDMRFMYLPMIFYLFLAGIPLRMMWIHRLDPLPIPRRTLLGALALPTVLVFLGGYAIGLFGTGWQRAHGNPVTAAVGQDRVAVMVPPGMLRIAWGGTPPTITAPWGESHAITGVPLVSGARPVAYSPYQTPRESSPDFVAWQASRALSDAYGTHVSWREVRDRYVTVRSDGTPGIAQGGLDFHRDHPELVARGAGPLLPLVLIIALVPFLLVFAGFVSTFRARFTERQRMVLYWVLVGGTLALWMLPFILKLAGLAWEGLATGAPAAMLVDWAHASGARTAALWVMALLSVAASWALAERQFGRMEVPARPIKLSLADCVRDDQD